MKRRTVLKSALAGTAALAAPRIVSAQKAAKTVTFAPHADLASLDPVWTTADITRNYSMQVFDTLYALDAKYDVQPQMVAGDKTENDGKIWDLTLRDGLKFHDGEKVLAKDCVATIKRFAKRNPYGQALMKRVDDISAASDNVIRFKLNKPFPLLRNALAEIYCAIMPERLAMTDPFQQIPEAIGSGPFKFVANERIPGSRVVMTKNDAYVPRSGGVASFNAGPKIVNIDRTVWNFIPDASTISAALANGEIDWWEQPSIDLVPSMRKNKDITIVVKDRTGEIGCLRFNHLLPPFNNPAIRRVVLAAMDQKEIIEAYAGAEPSLIKTDVGIFVPGTPQASTVGVEQTRGPKDYAKLKKDLMAAGYDGQKIVVLAATTLPNIWAEAQVATDVLTKIGFNVDMQTLEWGTVVQRRASKNPVDKGGWNIFYTYLGGPGNISPAPAIGFRGNGDGAWFGWPTDAKTESLYDAWFEAPDMAAQKKITDAMQAEFWLNPPYVPLGMYDQPTAFRSYITDIPDGFPQFYSLKKNI
jgi:peptide/nickel transport system substrate-binding protein